MTYESLLLKLFDLTQNFHNTNPDERIEEFKVKYPYMDTKAHQYQWVSKPEFKHRIGVASDYSAKIGYKISGEDDDDVFVSIEDSLEDDIEDMDKVPELDYNVLYVTETNQAAMCVQRHAGTLFLIADETIQDEDDIDTAIRFDMKTVTEEEWFQISTTMNVPTYEELLIIREFFEVAHSVCKRVRREITMTIGVEKDVNNLSYKEEDFE